MPVASSVFATTIRTPNDLLITPGNLVGVVFFPTLFNERDFAKPPRAHLVGRPAPRTGRIVRRAVRFRANHGLNDFEELFPPQLEQPI